MNWKEHIEAISAHATFFEPAEEQALFAAETQLGTRFPQLLRELLAESNGVRGEYDLALIWPVERIVTDNQSFRESESFRTLDMPFEGLLFFADAGNGDHFAFAVAGGQVRRSGNGASSAGTIILPIGRGSRRTALALIFVVFLTNPARSACWTRSTRRSTTTISQLMSVDLEGALKLRDAVA